jgi:hypothetical protein
MPCSDRLLILPRMHDDLLPDLCQGTGCFDFRQARVELVEAVWNFCWSSSGRTRRGMEWLAPVVAYKALAHLMQRSSEAAPKSQVPSILASILHRHPLSLVSLLPLSVGAANGLRPQNYPLRASGGAIAETYIHTLYAPDHPNLQYIHRTNLPSDPIAVA